MNAEVDATIGPILQVYAAEARRRLLRLRRRRARPADEPLPLGARARAHRRASSATSRDSRIRTATRRRRRASPSSGARTRRWSRRSPTARRSASSRRSSRTRPASRFTRAACRAASRSTGRRWNSPSLYDVDEVRELGGIVDYTVGPPGVKVFCLAEHPDPKQQHYLELYKMGEGPLYPFWIPYHLPHFERRTAIARVVAVRRRRSRRRSAVRSSRCAPSRSAT